MQLCVALVALFFALFASASHSSGSWTRAHRKHAVLDVGLHCGPWDAVTAGPYSLLLDQWGASEAAGEQCAHVISLSGNKIAWETKSNWMEGGGIKSFTNIQLNAGLNKRLSAIRSIPATWKWAISSTSVRADVAFDLFTSDSPGGPNVYEFMIWLGNYNSSPISHEYAADGYAVPTTSHIVIGDRSWSLYTGSNGVNRVFSFVTESGPIQNFKGNLLSFFEYLMKYHDVDSSQYLITAQGGTESISGSSTFTTKKYSLSIN